MKNTSTENLADIQTKYIDRSLIARVANRIFFEAITKILRPLSVRTVLDAGCGEGVILDLLYPGISGRRLGLDLDPARIKRARIALPDTDLIVGDAHRIPLKEEAFDLVLLLEVLEHVGDPHVVLSELHRITGNYVLISVPHEPWWRIGNMMRLKYLNDWGNTPEHINHWTRNGIVRLVSHHFRVIEVRNPFLWTFVLAEKL